MVHYIILKVNIIFLVFVSFSHFFSQLMQILLYVFTRLAFLSHLRHCKYHYYGMFILSVFVAKVLCLIKITFSVSHLTFHDCNSSIGMMPFPLCVTVELPLVIVSPTLTLQYEEKTRPHCFQKSVSINGSSPR